MFDNGLISLLPDAYEGLESVTATPEGDCKDGWINTHACRDGGNYSSCSCGPVYGS